jgi:hypothetical protein
MSSQRPLFPNVVHLTPPDEQGRAFVLIHEKGGAVTIQLRRYGEKHGQFEVVHSGRVDGDVWVEKLAELDWPAWDLVAKPVLHPAAPPQPLRQQASGAGGVSQAAVVRVGARYGRRVVVREATPDLYGRRRVMMRCDCGNEALVLVSRAASTTHCVHCNGGARGRTWKRRAEP